MNPPSAGNRALAKLRANELVKLYVTGNFATPRHIDFICRSGQFDALWFDLEHFDLPTQEVALLNMVARAYPVTTIARFKASDYQTVMRILEIGVGGIMCSMVNSAAASLAPKRTLPSPLVSLKELKSTMPSGSHASGETGRRTWMIGSNIFVNDFESPRKKPMGVPMMSAIA